jgi:hypothetical protein
MCSEVKPVKNHIIKFFQQNIGARLSERQNQWAWFVGLWCAGLFGVLALGGVIKLVMGV